MQKAINTLTSRIEKLNKELEKIDQAIEEAQMISEYHFALNDIENIVSEIAELQYAISILNNVKIK